MVSLKQERSKELFETFEREAGLLSFPLEVAVEFAKQHLIYRSKKTLNPTSPLWLSRCREHKAHLEIYGNLLDMLRGKIGTIVCVENFWNAANVSTRMAGRHPSPPFG